MYSPVCNRSAGTITFFLEKKPARHVYLKRHVLISLTKEQRTLEKIADFVKKKHSSDRARNKSNVLFCFGIGN